MKEKIVETKICKHCDSKFEITDKDLEFYEKVSPSFSWVRYSIPTPTLCPDCRQQRRLSFRNERKLYKRKCDATWIDILSIYSPDKSVKVYEQKEWWSDKWDAMDYGIDYDFNRNFFEQFEEIFIKTPRLPLFNIGSENSDYCNNAEYLKDCYLCFWTSHSTNTLYSTITTYMSDSVDVSFSGLSSDSYDILDCTYLKNCFHVTKCHSSSYLYYCFDCIWCEDCIFSVWLRNKKYMILNTLYNKDEYEKKKIEILQDTKLFWEFYKEYEYLLNTFPRRSMLQIQSENCTWWVIMNCSNSVNCYDSIWLETCKNIDNAWWGKNCMDVYALTSWSEYVYDSLNVKWYQCSFCIEIVNWDELIYCYNCHNCSNCFWSAWLRDKKYCILNKQYSKEEYERLVPKIIESMKNEWTWWEFFSSYISPYWYNETIANEYKPIKKEEAIKEWFKWSDYEQPFPKVEKIIPASKLPDNISDIPDDILNRAVECEITKKPFKIIKQELEFYRKHNLPIPRRHPDQRHLDRIALRNPRKLYDRKCDKCKKEIKTTYAPDRTEIVYCEECYNWEIY